MELAPPYTLLSLFSLFYTVYAVNTVLTALNCLNISKYAYINCYKVRALLDAGSINF